jgi:sensor histidine kinase YesM
VELPTQLIQPLLENSIEHGLLPNKGGKLAIRFKNIQDYLIIEIMDDGVGLKHHKAVKTSNKTNASLGNTITGERIALINQKHKNKIRFSLTNKPGIDQSASGTLALLEIPLK